MRIARWIVPLVAIGLMLSSVGLVSAQEGGAISGVVTDAETSQPIEGALVEVEGTELSSETDASGAYTIADVPVGSYSVTASDDGYESETEANVEVTTDATATVDFVLQPSEAEEEPEEGKHKGFVGTVEDMSEGSFTLTRQGTGDQITIGLPDEYILKTPGGPRAGTFEDGARVAVLTRLAGEDWVAERVLVKPVKPMKVTTGVVVDVEDGIVTIMRPNGTTETFQLPLGGDMPAIGELVTAFPDEPSETGGPAPQAKGLVRASQVRNRLRRHLEEITVGDGDLPEGALQARARHVQVLSQLLESHMGLHEQVLNRVLERVPDKAKEAIQRAKENAQKARQQAEEAIGRAKGKAGTSAQGKGSPDGQPERPDNKGNQSQGGSEEGGGPPQDKGKGPPTKEPGKPGK